ncbi:MAG: FmdB family transcriptional regulator [Proteobacteria bacterium]|nr:MAG: FmdB family transcriptional regulator [Pseudomonadota bacterium]
MPIYAYQCKACGHELETLQKISDAPLTDCPACQQSALSKKVTAAAFRLGGGGWYETDFKSGDKKNIASKDSASDSSNSTDSKTDTKPAPACDTGACPACSS